MWLLSKFSTQICLISFLTADILLSFSEHPPLKLPAEGFVLDLENGPSDQSFFHYLDAVKQAMNPGNDMVTKRISNGPQTAIWFRGGLYPICARSALIHWPVDERHVSHSLVLRRPKGRGGNKGERASSSDGWPWGLERAIQGVSVRARWCCSNVSIFFVRSWYCRNKHDKSQRNKQVSEWQTLRLEA